MQSQSDSLNPTAQQDPGGGGYINGGPSGFAYPLSLSSLTLTGDVTGSGGPIIPVTVTKVNRVAPTNTDLVDTFGDAGGVEKVIWRDTSGNDVGSINSDGLMEVDGGFNFHNVAEPTSGSVGLILAAGNLTAGVYYYYYTFTTAIGETRTFYLGSVTTDGTHLQVTVNIPVSTDYRVTGRKIYRSKVGGPNFTTYLLATIADNTTTSYVDNIADASLTVVGGFYTPNTTNKLFTVNGFRSAMMDAHIASFGYLCCFSMVAVGYTAAFGTYAGYNLTTGAYNSLYGHSSGYNLISGGSNTFSGFQAGYNISTGNDNVAIGRQALSTANGASAGNTVIGNYAMYAGTPGVMNSNTAYGYAAGRANNGTNNMFFGYNAARYETGSFTLIIDCMDRTNEAGGRAGALVYGVANATVANQTLFFNATCTFQNITKHKTYTVATLPAGVAGAKSFVTDASGPTFGAAVVGGGAVGVPVYHDGTSWKVG